MWLTPKMNKKQGLLSSSKPKVQKKKRGATMADQCSQTVSLGDTLGKIFKYSSLFGLVVVLGLLMLQIPKFLDRFPLQEIEVDGTLQYVDRAALRRVVLDYTDLKQHKNYFTVELPELQERLHQLPWVESVEVRKYWPNILRLTVEERVAIAIWDDDQLISHKGDLFKPTRMIQSSDLPRLYGPLNQARFVMENYHEMSKVLRSTQLRITELHLEERLAWNLKLNHQIEVVIDKNQSVEKLLRFVDLYTQLQQNPVQENDVKIARVDLRYSNGIAIEWTEASRG